MIKKRTFYHIMNRVRNQLELYKIKKSGEIQETEPVTVAVLDSGIDIKHPDLEGKLLAFQDFIAKSSVPYDDTAMEPMSAAVLQAVETHPKVSMPVLCQTPVSLSEKYWTKEEMAVSVKWQKQCSGSSR